MDLQAIGCINKAGLGKNEQTGPVPPPQKRQPPGAGSRQGLKPRGNHENRGPGNSQTSQGGHWAPSQAGRGREAGAKSPIDPGLMAG